MTFVGRPNVGKSTLTNALVGEKVAITSSKPQTTRRAIRGIVHRQSGQLILVDTPGMHRPRTLLGERLNDVVQSTLADVDVIGFCVPANEKLGPGDRFINEQLDAYPRAKKVAIVTKMDATSKSAVAAQLLAVSALRDWETIIPVSAVSRIQLDVLTDELMALLPVSEPLYPEEAVTEEGLEARIVRAHPGGGAGGRRGRAAALDRDHHRRHGGAGRQGAAGGLREPVGGAGQPEGHHHRAPGQRGWPRSARAPGHPSSRWSASRCSCRCG